MILIIFLVLSSAAFAQTWDLSDNFGVATVQAPVELPYTGGPIAHASYKVTGPLGEYAWQQLSNGNIMIMQPAKSASKLAVSYRNKTSTPTPGCSGAGGGNNNGSYYVEGNMFGAAILYTPPINEIMIPRTVGGHAPNAELTSGNVYYVVGSGQTWCNAVDGGYTAFSVSATVGGASIGPTGPGGNVGDPFWDWTISASTWDGSTGIRSHSTFNNSDPVQFRCQDSCTLPTGLSAGTTYYLKTNGTDLYLVYSDHALTSQVNVTGAGSGPNEIISSAIYTLSASAPAATQTNPVVITSNGNYWDITNGLMGVRIPQVFTSCAVAPIQGIQTPNGWTGAANPNYIYLDSGTTYPQVTQASTINSCTLAWVEKGPLIAHAQINYIVTGTGNFRVDVTLYAGQKFAEIEYDTTLNVSQYLNVSSTFDTIRWRNNYPASSSLTETAATLATSPTWRLPAWSAFDQGTIGGVQIMRHALLYQAAGASNTDLIGIFGGWVDRQIQAEVSISPNITYNTSAHPATGTTGTFLTFGINKGSGATEVRRRFGIYASTKADLPASLSTVSPMALTSFQYSWGPSMSKLLTPQYAPPPDPGGGWPCPFLASSECSTLIASMRNADPTAFNNLMNTLAAGATDPYGQLNLRAWRANDSTAGRPYLWYARPLLNQAMSDFYTTYGNYSLARCCYELFYDGVSVLGNVVGALNDSNSSAYIKTEAKRFLGLYCGWAFDPNWEPLDNPAGENFGLQNQGVQSYLERQMFASNCASQPYVSTQVNRVEAATRGITFPLVFNRYGDGSGANQNASGYIPTGTEQIKNAYLAMITARGITLTPSESSLFAAQSNQEYAIATPPDPRFAVSGQRVLVPFGDTGYETDFPLGTSAKFVPDSGAKWFWVNALAKSASSFFLPALFVYDWADVVPSVQHTITSAYIPKYLASLRTGYGTANESLLLHLMGPSIDHMHTGEDNSFQIWALTAPLSVSYNNLYTPQIFSRLYTNNVIMDSEATWTADSPSLSALSGRFSDSVLPTTTGYFAGNYVQWSESQQAKSGGPTWTRRVRLISFNAAHPIITVHDDFGADTAYKIISYNQQATGAVTSPAGTGSPDGTVTPIVRDWVGSTVSAATNASPVSLTFSAPHNIPNGGTVVLAGGTSGWSGVNGSWTATVSSPTVLTVPVDSTGFGPLGSIVINGGLVAAGTALASNGTAYNLTASALNTFGFTQGNWTKNNGVVNWNFIVNPGGTSPQFLIGSWCDPIQGALAGAYGANPKECQHIFRARVNGTTEAHFSPYLKASADGTWSIVSSNTQRVIGGDTTTETPNGDVTATDGTNSVLATGGTGGVTYNNLTISGGPAECDWNATTGTCYVSGTVAGTRTVTLPVGFTITSGAMGRSGANYTFYHPGGAIPTTYSFTFSTTPVSRRTVAFGFIPPTSTTSVRLSIGGNYAVSMACSAGVLCSPSVEVPSTSQTWIAEYLDSGGAVLFTGNPGTI